MTESIKLYRSEFGQVSILNVASDFVTHAHFEAHIILWLEGTAGEMTIDGEIVGLGPSVAAGINSFEPHSHALSQTGLPGLFLAFYIDPDWIRRRHALPVEAPIFARPFIPLNPWLHGAAANLVGALSGNDGADDLAVYEIERLIDGLIDAARPKEARGVRMLRMHDFRVCKAINLMNANVCERICFDQVARDVGLSRPHFFALFREQMKVTPNVYWNTLRINEAVRRLQSSNDSLTSVASGLGFTSQGNFSRFFRDHIGVPPTIYRSAARAAA